MLRLATILCVLQLGAAAPTEEEPGGCLQFVEKKHEGCAGTQNPVVWELPKRSLLERRNRHPSLERRGRLRRSVEGMEILRDAGERAEQWCDDVQKQKERRRAALMTARSNYFAALKKQQNTQEGGWCADAGGTQFSPAVLEYKSAYKRAESAYRKAEEEEEQAKKFAEITHRDWV